MEHFLHKEMIAFLVQENQEFSLHPKNSQIFMVSGVGARGYYRKLGYELEEPYMCKRIR